MGGHRFLTALLCGALSAALIGGLPPGTTDPAAAEAQLAAADAPSVAADAFSVAADAFSAAGDPSLRAACPRPVSMAFVDVSDDNVHAAAIACLVARNIVRGIDDRHYGPSRPVNRAQMATFLAQAIEQYAPLPAASGRTFSDVDGLHADNIERLREAGVVSGRSRDRYDPSARVTRAQMATFLVATLEYVTGAVREAPPGPFVDITGNVHARNIEILAASGVAHGTTPTTYSPALAVRRDQMSSFIARLLALMSAPEDALGTEQPPALGEAGGTGQAPAWEPADPDAPTAADDPPVGDLPGHEWDYGTPTAAVHDTGERPEDIEATWERLEAAGAVPQPPPDGSGDEAWGAGASADAQIQVFPGQPIYPMHSYGYLPYPHLPTTVGQLLSTAPNGRASTCSGTVVARNLVLTAFHCVYNTQQQGFNSGFTFIPDRHGAQERYGRWYASRFYYYQEAMPVGSVWKVETHALDYALLEIPPRADGRYLGDIVGYEQILMGTHNLWLPRYAMGYPIQGAFSRYCDLSSCYPFWCYGNAAANFPWRGGWYSKAVGCLANGGISGGPIFEIYQGRRYVASVASTMWFSEHRNTHWMRNLWGPSFNHWLDSLWSARALR